MVKRFNPDGGVDPSFGTDGQVILDQLQIPRQMAHDVLGGRVIILAEQLATAGGIRLTRIWL